MGRLFGTDGVRGLANADLTPELALAVAVAAAHVLAEADRSHPPLAVVGRDPRASGEMLEAAVVAGLDQRRRQRGPGRRAAHPGGRVPHRRGQGRPRRDALRLAQPDAGQRHQALRRRRAQAARRDRGRDRGGRRRRPRPGRPPDRRRRRPGARPARRRRALRQAPGRRRRRTASTGSRSWSTARTAPPPRSRPAAYRRGRRRGRSRSTPSPTASTSTTTAAPPTSTALRAAVVEHGADLGIAHDGDADRCLAVDRRPATRSTATRSWRSSRWPCATPARSPRTPWSPP